MDKWNLNEVWKQAAAGCSSQQTGFFFLPPVLLSLHLSLFWCKDSDEVLSGNYEVRNFQ